MLFYIISLLYAAAVIVTVRFMLQLENKKYCVSKGITSMLFLVLGVLVYAQKADTSFWWLLLGLVFCFAGDLFLALAHEIDGSLLKKWFVPGVLSFLLAHLVFVFGYSRLVHISRLLILAVAVGIVVYTWFTTRSPRYDYRGFQRLCMFYAFFVGMFCGSGIWLLYSARLQEELLFFGVGAVLFLISDMLLSAKYFMRRAPKIISYFNLPVYYGGIYFMLLALR